jgi:integrase
MARFKGSARLFEKSTGESYNRVYITNRIREASKRILGKGISAHSLRHSKAMFLKDERNLTPDQIARSLGHSSVVTTLQHYFHGTPGPREQGIII